MEAGFATVTALAALVLLLSEGIDKMWNLDGLASQVRAVVLGIGLGLVGANFQWGLFADPLTCGTASWWVCGSIIGGGSAFGANFLFDTPIGKYILELFKLRPKQNGTQAPN